MSYWKYIDDTIMTRLATQVELKKALKALRNHHSINPGFGPPICQLGTNELVT
jgi:hypothetical protein